MLLVTDKSIYEDHKAYANSTVQNLVFLHMRSYFSHYMNGVNERFSNALNSDPDMKLNIVLTNFLFLTVYHKNNYEIFNKNKIVSHFFIGLRTKLIVNGQTRQLLA